MDPQSTTPEASYLIFLYTNVAKAIKDITDKYNATKPTSSIRAESSAISAVLNDIQSLLSHPHAFSSQVLPQNQLENALKNVYNSCNVTISKLEDLVGKWTTDQASQGSLAQLHDEVQARALLQQIQRQLTDTSLLIVAAQRNSDWKVRQLLNNDTFAGDPIDGEDQLLTPTSGIPGRDSRSVCSRASDNTSRMSIRSGRSDAYNSYDTRSVHDARSTHDARSIHDTRSLYDTRSIHDTRSVHDARSMVELSAAPSSPTLPSVPPLPKNSKKSKGSIFSKVFKSSTELHKAAKKGDLKKIKAYIDSGVDINYEGSSGCTALHLASDSGHEAVVRLLLSNGADPSVKSIEGRTPLHTAARIGNPAVVRLLLEKVVDIHARDPSGSTALHVAAFNGHESVVQILLEKHPWLEVRGGSGFTPLHVASFNGQSAVVRLLVEMGADLEARSDTGRTALQLAAERGHESVVRHLLQHGANVMVKDNRGRTALQGAVANQHAVVAELLLDKAVSPDSQSSQQHPGYRSGPTYEMGGDSFFRAAGPLPTKTPVWSQQPVNAPMCELPAAVPMAVEMPAGNWNGGLKDKALIPGPLHMSSQWKRVEDT